MTLTEAIAYIFPAYVANGSPVVFVRMFGGGHPLDLGVRAWDGRRVLGDGKTFEGLISGTLSGFIVGLIIFSLGNTGGFRSPLEPLILSLGAMCGDILGAFVKRRMGIERGRPAPILDQLGFLITALAFAYMVYGPPVWLDGYTLAAILLITIVLHISTNVGAYLLGLKDRPY